MLVTGTKLDICHLQYQMSEIQDDEVSFHGVTPCYFMVSLALDTL